MPSTAGWNVSVPLISLRVVPTALGWTCGGRQLGARSMAPVTASATLWLRTTSSTPTCCADMLSWGTCLHSPSSCTAAM